MSSSSLSPPPLTSELDMEINTHQTTRSSSLTAIESSPEPQKIKFRERTTEDGKVYMHKGFYAPYCGELGESKSTAMLQVHSNLKSRRTTLTAMDLGAENVRRTDLEWESIPHQPLLPLPVHHGRELIGSITLPKLGEVMEEPGAEALELRAMMKEFRLPYDIMRDFYENIEEELESAESSEFESEDEVMISDPEANSEVDERGRQCRKGKGKALPKYTKLPKNRYFERKPVRSEVEAICLCKPATDCLEKCINRMMFYTCSPKTCPTGGSCSNVPMHLRPNHEGLKEFWTGNRGFGLKTTTNIKKGAFIIEYRGEIISRNESYRRVTHEYASEHSYYFLNYDGDEVIDAGLRGSIARFINHSCGGNTQCYRWKLSELEEYEVGIFAKEDIKAGTELTYDYCWQDYSTLTDLPPSPSTKVNFAIHNPARQRCYCKSENCSGFLGAKKEKVVREKKVVAVAPKIRNKKTSKKSVKKSVLDNRSRNSKSSRSSFVLSYSESE